MHYTYNVRIVPGMPQRTVYLSEELDQLATSLELSLSPLLQNAILEEAQRRGAGSHQPLEGPSRFRKEQGVTNQGISRSGGSGIQRGWESGRDW